MFSIENHSHRRYNPLTGRWVLVSPHRSKRPWQGQKEKTVTDELLEYDPSCYLCPGNERANGEINPDYTHVFSFKNDFSALQDDVPNSESEDSFFRYKSERGICKVICFNPRHDLTLPEMKLTDIIEVIKLWVKEYQELSRESFIHHVQIFENKGSIMGCSNPHPHGQIWAQESIPDEVKLKDRNQYEYMKKKNSNLLLDYVSAEIKEESRVLYSNLYFAVIVPFWATWPFETMIIPLRKMSSIADIDEKEILGFADALRFITIKYDNLFEVSFPYSAGIHQAPCNGKDYTHWQWHMSFYPPLLRSATVKKFMVGYEMFADAQRDITAEQAAERLRVLPSVHYKSAKES